MSLGGQGRCYPDEIVRLNLGRQILREEKGKELSRMYLTKSHSRDTVTGGPACGTRSRPGESGRSQERDQEGLPEGVRGGQAVASGLGLR